MEARQPPKMVGRERELATLTGYLDDAIAGKGRCVFISGEAGIGKTRLIQEVKTVAAAKGFRVLSASCFYGPLTPYMPFYEALKSGGLEHLLAHEAPRVNGAFLITNTGLLVKEVRREVTPLDPDLFASMLNTVADFARESALLSGGAGDAQLSRIGFGEHTVLVEHGERVNLAVTLSGKENEFLREDMREILAKINAECGELLIDWTGGEAVASVVAGLLDRLISSGKYDGLDYGESDPKAKRDLLFENVGLGLVRASSAAPTLLCLEDLQEADPSSLALIRYVARTARGAALLIVATYRPEDLARVRDVPHSLTEVLARMRSSDLHESLELHRLPEEGVREILESSLSPGLVDEDLSRLVYVETDGNPLFVVELTRLLVDRGYIASTDGQWRLSGSVGLPDIPTKVHEVIAVRLDRLGEAPRRVLDIGAVLGEELAVEVLRDVAGLPKEDLLRILDSLQRRHGLLKSWSGSYRFDHIKVRDVLYEGLSANLRSMYHGLIAESIVRHHGTGPEAEAATLAFHLSRSDEREKAIPFFLKAAEDAAAGFANEEAIAHLTEALALERDAGRRVELLSRRGVVQMKAGEVPQAHKSFSEALRLTDESRIRAHLKGKIGQCLIHQGSYDEALRTLQESLAAADSPDWHGWANILSLMGDAHQRKGEHRAALEYLERAHQKGIELRDLHTVAQSLHYMGHAFEALGDYERAMESLERALQTSTEVNDQSCRAADLSCIGGLFWRRGLLAEALERFESSLAVAEKRGSRSGIEAFTHNIGVIQKERGAYDQAMTSFRRSLRINEVTGNQMFRGNHLNAMASVHAARGELVEAIAFGEQSLQVYVKLGARDAEAGTRELLAECHLSDGNLSRALELSQEGLALARETGSEHEIGQGLKVRAMVLGARGDWEKAVDDFEESIRTNTKIGNQLELAPTLFEYGKLRARMGHTDQARRLLGQALELFERQGREALKTAVQDALANL